MCGIAGYFGDRQISPDNINKCLTRMHRRGPDYAAHKHWQNVAGKNIYLLHTRLSIIDIDKRSNQPFRIGSKWIILNGELYNYLELRADLTRRGCSFATSSDTEVLLQSIECLGWEALDACEGMWAFAVYDEAAGALTLCRDRFGEKPLYMYQDRSGVYFASEVKFIAALLDRRLEINYKHLYRYMINGYRALFKGTETFFNGVVELSPSGVLHIDANGKGTQGTCWQPRICTNDAMTFSDAVDGVRERLIKSVKLRLRSDVPLAFCMSGGVDSNSLISIAKKILKYEVHGFTIVNTDSRYEEQEMVDHAVSGLGIRHTAIPLNIKNGISMLKTLVRHHDAPVATATYFVHWLLMRSVAEHGYRVSISGTAADELFTGYYDHHLAYLSVVRDIDGLYEDSLKAWKEYICPDIRSSCLRNPNLFINDPGFRDHIYHDSGEFRQYLAVACTEGFTERQFTHHLLHNRMLNELFHESVPVILHEEDLNAMYYSVENRSPYLDRELFEFSFSIPPRHLIRNGFAKAVLREAMRGIVPEEILDNRKKVGFNAPVFSFLDTKDPEARSYIIDDGPIFSHVKRDNIEELINKDYLSDSENKFLFGFLCGKIFLEEFGT